MMKSLSILVMFVLVACGRESSPEGRSIIRDEQIQAQINLLKEQHKAMHDSIMLITNELKTLKHR